jgi:3-methyladenine DNA glycosylase/8-oxoguanine DNA glycosylase
VNGSCGCSTADLAETPHHRYREQLAFLRRFPGYTTEAADNGVTLWYWDGSSPRRLEFRPSAAGISVRGDIAMARWVLQADAPPLPPPEALPEEPAAHRVIRRRYGGIRPVLFADPFEGIAWTILGQQISVAAAGRLKAHLAARYGRRLAGSCGPITLFPRPADIASATLEDLHAAHLSRQKALALLGIARGLVEGTWDPGALRNLPVPEALRALQQLRGIGPWSAEYILLRVAGHPDVVPAGDVALRRAWARRTGSPTPVPEPVLRRAAAPWAGWRSDFAFCLWLDNLAARGVPVGPPPDPPGNHGGAIAGRSIGPSEG